MVLYINWKIIINNKITLLKTSVIVKLNLILSDLKEKSEMDDVYNYNDIDKLYMIYKDLKIWNNYVI